jgi:ribosomal protein S18 acetylase RimI-like enzyme
MWVNLLVKALLFMLLVPGVHIRIPPGGTLLEHVEHHLHAAGPGTAQVLIVETSSTDQYARTREFYPKQGYTEEARIRRFYGPDDDKVVYWKLLTA